MTSCFLSLTCVLVTFRMTVTKYLFNSHFRRERFISGRVLEAQSTAWKEWWQEQDSASSYHHRETRKRRQYWKWRHALNRKIQLHLLPVSGLHLPRVSQSPKAMSPVGDKVNTHNPWRTCYIQTIILFLTHSLNNTQNHSRNRNRTTALFC